MNEFRPDISRHVRGRLAAFGDGFRQNLALIGPSGSGKTFHLRQLMQSPPVEAAWIYGPLYQEPARSFLQRFRWAILHAGLSTPLVASHLSGGAPSDDCPLDMLLRVAQTPLPKTAAAIRAVEPLLARRSLTEAFTGSLDAIPVLSKELDTPCVLMLDEFVWLQEMGFAQPFHEVGKRVMTWPSTLFVLASSAPYRARRILQEQLHLLFGQFELITFDPVHPAQVTTWIREELGPIRGAEVIGPFLAHWLGASPWALTVFVKRVKELAALGRADEPPEALLLATAWDVLGSQEGTLHQWCRSRIEGLSPDRLGARATEALVQIAGGVLTQSALAARLGRSRLSEALQMLLEHDLVTRHGSCWVVPDPILRSWLSNVLAAQRSTPRSDGTPVRERFAQGLSALWARWRHERQLSVSQQVAAWLSRFNDEVVSLDSKSGHLPKFETITAHAPDTTDGPAYLIASGEGARWCVTVHDGPVDEGLLATFDRFCRIQPVKPSRKVVVTTMALDEQARVLAKAAKMWVWDPAALRLLRDVYGSPA